MNAKRLTELPLLGSNQDSPDPESGVLPVTPRGSSSRSPRSPATNFEYTLHHKPHQPRRPRHRARFAARRHAR